MSEYAITKTQPTVYLDAGGRPVRGFLVSFAIPEYDELHEIQLPTLDPSVVGEAIEKFIASRDAIAELGA